MHEGVNNILKLSIILCLYVIHFWGGESCVLEIKQSERKENISKSWWKELVTLSNI